MIESHGRLIGGNKSILANTVKRNKSEAFITEWVLFNNSKINKFISSVTRFVYLQLFNDKDSRFNKGLFIDKLYNEWRSDNYSFNNLKNGVNEVEQLYWELWINIHLLSFTKVVLFTKVIIPPRSAYLSCQDDMYDESVININFNDSILPSTELIYNMTIGPNTISYELLTE